MTFSDDFISRVKDANDIVDVIGKYVQLKKSGSGYFGLCPFHHEKSPSFHVDPVRQLFKCFGCAVGGDVITFIMKIENYSYPEAIRALAERAGIPLPKEENSAKVQQQQDERDRLRQLMKTAARYFLGKLHEEGGVQARRYLLGRGLSVTTINRFGFGWAPDEWHALSNYLRSEGYTADELFKAGLTVRNDNGKEYDRFRGRVMIPIIDPKGNVIAFGGRVLDDSQPKYLNSSEGPLFNKSSTLFGLNIARKHMPLSSLILVEGYMDVVSMVQYGFENTVASMGTSLTEQQAQLLRRHTENVFVAYDGDTAGAAATVRGLKILEAHGLKVRVLRFTEGKDPDEILHSYGAEHFSSLIANAPELTEYRLLLARSDDMRQYAHAAAEILSELTSPIDRDAYIKKLERETGVDAAVLRAEISIILEKRRSETERRNVPTAEQGTAPQGGHRQQWRNPSQMKSQVVPKLERQFLLVLLRGSVRKEEALRSVESRFFENSGCGSIFGIMRSMFEAGDEVTEESVLNRLETVELREEFNNIMNEVPPTAPDTFMQSRLKVFRQRRIDTEIDELLPKLDALAKSSAPGDIEEFRRLSGEVNRLLNER